MQQLRSSGGLLFGSHLKRKALNSWTAMQDTYFSTKDTFERHKVVFTIGTSVASVATAWAGYSLRHLRDSKVDQRLEAIENAMKNNYHLEHAEFKKLVDPERSSVAACIATAGTTFVIGYGLGWRGGRWYASKKFRKEQMKLSGQIKPKRWQLLRQIKPRGWQFQFLKKRLARSRAHENAAKTSEKMLKDGPTTRYQAVLSDSVMQSVDHDNALEDFYKLIGMSGTSSRIQGIVSELASPPSADDGICKKMVEKYGYACEEHTVTTKDGFILGLQRIPKGRSSGTPGKKPPVLLQHGLLTDAIIWVLLSPEKSLAFILADNGFDVWLANTRGTKSSRGHTSLSPEDPDFWDWSWDELAAYDLPAVVQYVHDQTRQNVHFVGHSLGTIIALAALSKDQSLDMLRSAALFCPTAYLGQMTSPVAKVAADIFTANAPYWLNLAEFEPTGIPALKLLNQICKAPGVNCSDLLSSFTGPNCCLDTSRLGALLDHGPQSTATKNLLHVAQMVKEGTITMYDYSNGDENKKHYGQPTPPVYDMADIPKDFPLFLGHGGADALSDVQDVKLLLDSLKDHAKDKLVVLFIKNYAHSDFVAGENAKQVAYDPLIAFLKAQ
ncbi:unnamed protein product [Dovyalis caffra]|uniref:Triacylglycerol lipase n=1 Tax=Dovyalis caffra TaxID=77055 RepID=A0AAV1SF54_9ROSI|nr:unnamed protein product [Dovyalis caffra]